MSEGTVTRRLVKQEWKPLAGPSVERFVAVNAGNSVPGDQWETQLPGKSRVQNEVIGYAEFPAHSRFPETTTYPQLLDVLDANAERIISWQDGWQPEGTQDATDAADGNSSDEQDPDPTPDEESTVDAVEAALDELHSEMVVTVEDGNRVVVSHDPEDEPYRLPGDATEDDLRPGVIYVGIVNNIVNYGVFVYIPNTGREGEDVSGLVHRQSLGLQSPGEFRQGQKLLVEHEDNEGGPSFDFHGTFEGADPDQTYKYADKLKRAKEAENDD